MSQRVFFFIKVAVALILLSLIFFTVELGDIWEALKTARFSLIIFGVALMPVNLFLQIFKWRYLVGLVHPKVTWNETYGSLLAGISFGIITPGRIGEYSRSLFIKDVPPLKLVGLTVIDKFYNLGCTVAFGLPALMTLPWANQLISGYMFVSMMILVFIINGILLWAAIDPRPVRSLIYALQMMFPRKDHIARLLGGLDRFSAPQARKTLVLSLLHYTVFHLQYFFLISGFAKIDFFSSLRAAAAILFTKSALPIAIGDLGLDQHISMQFFGEFGVADSAAFNASILMFTANILIPALIGVLFVSRLQQREKYQEKIQ